MRSVGHKRLVVAVTLEHEVHVEHAPTPLLRGVAGQLVEGGHHVRPLVEVVVDAVVRGDPRRRPPAVDFGVREALLDFVHEALYVVAEPVQQLLHVVGLTPLLWVPHDHPLKGRPPQPDAARMRSGWKLARFQGEGHIEALDDLADRALCVRLGAERYDLASISSIFWAPPSNLPIRAVDRYKVRGVFWEVGQKLGAITADPFVCEVAHPLYHSFLPEVVVLLLIVSRKNEEIGIRVVGEFH
mmetsp:Transcript_36010/g.85420  ORF Transcript_36010/g.85420 Transcript_36010/m.85420 type:complete len:242 (+) Transcript_36010:2636-3361(+)